MKFNGRFCLLILAVGLLLATFSSAALAAGDTVAITIEKWTSSFGSMSGSTGPMVVDEDDGGVFTFSGFYAPTFDSDPFAGALDLNVIFALDSTSTDSALLNSNVDIKKDSTSDTSQYWIKIFVEKKSTSASGGSAYASSPGYTYPSGSPLSASTTYSQTTASFSDGTMSSLIKDSVNSTGLGSATIPGSLTSGSGSFTRTDATYDIKQEYDVHFTTNGNAHVELLMTTTVVPEPVTILSALIGLVPMGLMVRSIRRRKAVG